MPWVVGEVDRGHAPTAEFTLDLVGAEPSAR